MTYENWGVSDEAIGNGISPEQREAITSDLIAARTHLLDQHTAGTLEYLDLPRQDIDAFESFANGLPTIDTVLLIGIGGSSLGPRAVFEAWDGTPTRRLIVSENIDPNGFQAQVKGLNPQTTMVVVITKSGSTIETMAKFWHVWDHFQAHVDDPTQHFVAVTDPDNGPLRGMLPSLGIPSFEVPPAVGGRFSVMSAVGLVPLALVGYPIAEFLAGADEVVRSLKNNPDAIFAGVTDYFLLHGRGFDQTVLMPYVDALSGFSEWFCQLWGESLGKRFNLNGDEIRVGLTPIRALGAVDQHSQVQLYVEGPLNKHVVLIENRSWADINIPPGGLPGSLSHLEGKTFAQLLTAELQGTKAALRDAGCPVSRLIVDKVDPATTGALMMNAMISTSLMGSLLNINPYDQPGVELGKRVAHGLLGRAGFEEDAELASSEKSVTFDF